MTDNELTLTPRPAAVRIQPKWMVILSVLSLVMSLGGEWIKDRLVMEHTTTVSSVRVEDLENRQADTARRLTELQGQAVTKDELRADIHGLESRLDDLRTIMLELRSRR